jgi:hypothetical protein
MCFFFVFFFFQGFGRGLLTAGSEGGMATGLPQKDLQALLALLSDDTRAIEAVCALFTRTFAKTDHFRVATALW